MNTKFEQQRQNAMRKLSEALKENLVDEVMIPILDEINLKEKYYTTSSCAGRITLFHDVGSRYDDDFLAKWHTAPELDEVKAKVAEILNEPLAPAGIVWFRQESAILHVISLDLNGAIKILNMALKCGFKRSGIQVLKPERFMVELCGTERLDVPIMHNGKLLIDSDYLGYLVNLGKEKLGVTRKKLEKFSDELKGV